MNNPWKLATIGLALVGVTALSTGVTAAYLLRPSMPAQGVAGAESQAALAPAPTTVPRAVVTPAVMSRAEAPVATAAATRVVRPAAVQTVAADCSTGGQRAMKIAKPGLIGALGGAGLGAIGGAIADGGDGAGKGALIGGLAGTALGAGYGAYKTKQECGAIFGNGAAFANGALQAARPPAAPQAALRSTPGNGITVYNAASSR
jgi:hypothetical protein